MHCTVVGNSCTLAAHQEEAMYNKKIAALQAVMSAFLLVAPGQTEAARLEPEAVQSFRPLCPSNRGADADGIAAGRRLPVGGWLARSAPNRGARAAPARRGCNGAAADSGRHGHIRYPRLIDSSLGRNRFY